MEVANYAGVNGSQVSGGVNPSQQGYGSGTTGKKFLDTAGLNELVSQIATVFNNLNKQVDDLQKQVDEFITANEVDIEFGL